MNILLSCVPFAQLVGFLLQIAMHTRPAIMQRVMQFARICTCNVRPHFLVALRVLKYMYAIKEKNLTFNVNNNALRDNFITGTRLCIQSESNWAMGSVVSCQSYSGNTIVMKGDLLCSHTNNMLVLFYPLNSSLSQFPVNARTVCWKEQPPFHK